MAEKTETIPMKKKSPRGKIAPAVQVGPTGFGRVIGPDGTYYYKTGVVGLDDLLGSGIPEASSVLIEGGPGSGKTILCLNIGANFCMHGKKVLYMSFEEPEKKLLNHMRSFGWDAKGFVDSGLLRVKRFNALDIAVLASPP